MDASGWIQVGIIRIWPASISANTVVSPDPRSLSTFSHWRCGLEADDPPSDVRRSVTLHHSAYIIHHPSSCPRGHFIVSRQPKKKEGDYRAIRDFKREGKTIVT